MIKHINRGYNVNLVVVDTVTTEDITSVFLGCFLQSSVSEEWVERFSSGKDADVNEIENVLRRYYTSLGYSVLIVYCKELAKD